MQHHRESAALAKRSAGFRARERRRTAPGLLSVLLVVLCIGCSSGPLPATPPSAGGPTATAADSGTVRAVPTGAPSVTATPAGGPASPTTALAGSPTGVAGPATPPPATATAAPSPSPAAPIPTLVDAEAVIVYSVIAHDLVTQSQADAITETVPSYIGINPRAGRGAFLDTDSATAAIPDDLIDNLADLGTTVTFAPFADAVPDLEDGAPVRDDGIYLTLGEIQPQGDARHLAIYASFYRKMDDATGYRYLMEHTDDGAWVITDRQQVWDR